MSGYHESYQRKCARRKDVGNLHRVRGLLIFALLVIGSPRGSLVTAAHKSLTSSAAEACSIYASPSGKDENFGGSPKSPKTFAGAASTSGPGSVVCLLGGTYVLTSPFKPPSSGTPASWIIYRDYGDAPVKFVWAGAADASPMFDMNGGKFPSGPAYLEFRGLNLDGGGKAGDGFFCRGSHHLRFIGNSITNTGGSGIGTIQCDYLMVDHNTVAHNGYIPAAAGSNASHYSWTSGISLNSNQWYDSYRGFHNIISNNIVTGEVDQSAKHSDGNGIILDLSDRTYDYSSAKTPPALIVNNVVYGNGGRCIEAFVVTSFWIVNNTCYKNNLDPSIESDGSIVINNARDGYIVNNIVVAWNTSGRCYGQENVTTKIQYYRNLCFGGSDQVGLSDPRQVLQADPLFLSPPYFKARRKAKRVDPLARSMLGDGLKLLRSSPALHKGIDPATVPNLSETIITDLKKYVYLDIEGRSRPEGGSPDLGAYQRSGVH
ncbi:MAG: hypothetical protein JWO71_3412 [Candidatus Acidoferrum typicum]|nr:hypothetical protein [Candidatus Acidoferrum typicum]